MSTRPLDALKARVDFEAWHGVEPEGAGPLLHGLKLTQDAIEGLRPVSIREIDPGDGSRLLRATWTSPDQEGVILVTDLRECKSRSAAHDVVLELLANTQAPDVRRLEPSRLGDVSFGRESSTSMRIFVRGNVAVRITNGGKVVVPVDGHAASIDRWLVRQSDQGGVPA
jgi:hypothetical protein